MQRLSIVIPCYGSEHTIGKVVDEIKATLKTREFSDFEIILVNDYSPDNVFEVIKNLAMDDDRIKGINLSKNFGQHSAIMAGFNIVNGEIVVCLDDDGQTPANEIFKLIDKIDNGDDLVYAKYDRKEHSIFRNFGTKINDLMAKYLLSKPTGIYMGSYFACKRFVIDEAINYKNAYPYIAGLLLRTTNKISNVDVTHRKREIGTSGYTFKKLISLWLNGFTAFSIKPLRLATLIGVAFAFVGFFYGFYTIINKFIHPESPMGYASLMSAVMFIGGIILLMLGMIGEYLGRIYISINNAPQYVIRETINVEEKMQK